MVAQVGGALAFPRLFSWF